MTLHQAEEWIFVSRKKGRRLSRVQKRSADIVNDGTATIALSTAGHSSKVAGPENDSIVRPNPWPTRAVSDIRKQHDALQGQWRRSKCSKALTALLEQNMSQVPAVTNAVCIGPGSFEPVGDNWQWRRTAHLQVAAFAALTKILEEKSGRPIRRIVQEPAFTYADKAFCRDELGLEVVENPAVFDMVDATTLLWGIHLYVGVVHVALRKALPAVFIGSSLDNWQPSLASFPENHKYLGELRKMEATYYQCAFPAPDLEQSFSNTTMYWTRAPGGADGEAGRHHD